MKHMKGVEPITPEAPPRKRRFFFDHPILTEIVMIALWLALSTGLLFVAFRAGLKVEGQTAQLANAASSIVSAFLLALLFQLYFRHEFDGMFEWSSLGLLLVFPAIAFCVTNIFDFTAMQFAFLVPETVMNSVPYCLALALAPGIAEELMFRGIPLSNWMRTAEEDGTVMKCAWFTAILFGLVHGANAISGAAITATVYQVFYSICIGFFFGAVFLRTGSMWPTIILHTLMDFSAFLFMDMGGAGLMTEELTIGLDFFVTLGLSVLLVLLGLLMLRKSKREQIMQLWNRKWGKTGIVAQDRFRY